MALQPPEGMDKYLKPTEFCDSDNKEIKAKARELVKDAATQREAALSIFHFVRDSVKFALDFTDFRASHALKTRLGFCIHKPNLQIALLRAVKVPARSHRVGVKKESLQGVVPDLLYKAMPDAFNHHVWCECHLSGKWISCEALFDKELLEGMREKRVTVASQIPTIDWDGENDLIVVKPWVVKDFGTFDSLDDFWRETAKQLGSRLPSAAILSSNQYTDSLRKR